MGRALPIDNSDPDTLKLLGRAFDAAWQDVRQDCCVASPEDRRTRLALIVLELALRSERDEKPLRSAAVSIMAAESKDGSGPNMPRLH
jgi:hypothetical protein